MDKEQLLNSIKLLNDKYKWDASKFEEQYLMLLFHFIDDSRVSMEYYKYNNIHSKWNIEKQEDKNTNIG